MHDDAEATMKALTAPSCGPLSQLAVTDVPKPSPGPGQLLLRVHAAAVNPLDAKLVTGAMRDAMPVQFPFIPGVDAAGTVAAVGPRVTRFAVGDEVLALTFPAGAIAEYTVVHEESAVAHRPATLDLALAAALPTAGMTAAALVAGLKAGQSVLIVGATGGVGSFAVQLARASGARVLATAGPDDASYVRALGAGDVIDHTATDLTTEALRLVPGGVDLVVDLVNAGPGLAGSAALARPGGRLVSPLGGPDRFDRGVSATYLGVEAGFADLPALAKRAAAGELVTEIVEHPLDAAPGVMAHFVSGHKRGKTIITV